MNPKIKAWCYLQNMKLLSLDNAELVLLELIKNGAIHADEIWMAEKVIEAYEEVMGVEEDE